MDLSVLASAAMSLGNTTAIIAAQIFLPPPFGQIVAAALGITFGLADIAATSGIKGFHDAWGVTSAVMNGITSAVPGMNVVSVGKKALQTAAVSGATKLSKSSAGILESIANYTKKINNVIKSSAPDAAMEKIYSKMNGFLNATKNGSKAIVDLEDLQLIMRKEAELQMFGEVRTQNKINSVKENPKNRSPIKAIMFNETKFIDRNNILGTMSFVMWADNDSRLNNRVNVPNGNNQLKILSFNNLRYKNDYVSGACRAKSWMSYYMRHYMLGKPGRKNGDFKINTAILFGVDFRVDKKLAKLISSWKNVDKKALDFAKNKAIDFSFSQAKPFLNKSKVGSFLFDKKRQIFKSSKIFKG